MPTHSTTKEQWKIIPGYGGFYEASDQGRIRSVDRIALTKTGKTRHYRGRVRKPYIERYASVNLARDGDHKTNLVHHLILKAFVGPCPEGMECLHENGDSIDNRLENIRWGTPAENGKDRIRLDEIPCGERHYASRLTEGQVRDIRRKHSEGVSQHQLGRDYDHHVMTISAIVHRKTWKHVE